MTIRHYIWYSTIFLTISFFCLFLVQSIKKYPTAAIKPINQLIRQHHLDQIIKRYVCTNISGSKKNIEVEELSPYVCISQAFFQLGEIILGVVPHDAMGVSEHIFFSDSTLCPCAPTVPQIWTYKQSKLKDLLHFSFAKITYH